MMSLSNGEKKLLLLFLKEYRECLGSNGCNDLSDEQLACLSSEEWDKVNKEYHEMNGDPEEYFEGESLPDFCVVYYLQKKLESL